MAGFDYRAATGILRLEADVIPVRPLPSWKAFTLQLQVVENTVAKCLANLGRFVFKDALQKEGLGGLSRHPSMRKRHELVGSEQGCLGGEFQLLSFYFSGMARRESCGPEVGKVEPLLGRGVQQLAAVYFLLALKYLVGGHGLVGCFTSEAKAKTGRLGRC